MKLKLYLLLILLVISLKAVAQPAEEIYLGSVAKSGYSDNASFGPFNIGFNFTFYGNVYTQFYVSANGLVTFGSGTTDNTPDPIPSLNTPHNFIAPFWDDLIIDPFGNILYKTIGVSPNQKVIVQFRNMAFYTSPSYLGTFSVILYEGSSKIQIQYRMIVLKDNARAHGGTASIGIENFDGTAGVKYLHPNLTDVSTSKAISFSPSGSTYSIYSDETYYGVYLTTNLTLPEPGISDLISPTNLAVVGVNNTFEWTTASNATTYALQISTNPDLVGAVSYNAGSNLTYTLNGLTPGTTYYWTVFTSNATGVTYNEVKSFTTSATPPLATVPQTIWTEQLLDKTIKFSYTGGDASAKTAIITTLPAQGKLYQYNAGVRGAEILSGNLPATVTDANMNVIYAATGSSGNGVGTFNFKVNDAGGDSPIGSITVNVSPPGVPDVLYVAKNAATIEIQFDRLMADPSGKQSQFTVTGNTIPVTVNSVSLKAGDPNTIVLTLASTPATPVLLSYTQGDIVSSSGGFLFSFTDQAATLTSQTITFSQSLAKKYNNSPFTLTASAPGGSITYSSSNSSVATAAGSVLTFNNIGSSDITARQAGNATYAPAKYVKTLTVAKGDQIITFGVLAAKTYGDADFTLTAVAGSLLLVSYASSNSSVATVTGNTVHIVGTGSSVITASQAGNSLWNVATDVPQTLTVGKATATVTLGGLTKTYNGLAQAATATTTPAGLTVGFTYDGLATIPTNAASYAVIGTINNANYQGTASGTMTINKAALTASADNKTKTYGDANPSLTISYTGFIGTDNETNLTTPSVAATTGLQTSDAGTYPITVTGGTANNYSFTYVNGTHTITKAILTAVADNKTRIYGFANPAFTITYGGFIGTDNESNLTTPSVAATTVLQTSDAGTYPITVTGGTANNYSFIYVNGTFTITKSSLTVIADNKTKFFHAQNPVLTYTISGFVNGESQSVLDVLPAIQTTAMQNSPTGTYPITISGGSDNNYTYIYTAGTLTITKLQQTITISAYPEKLLVGDTYTLIASSTSGLAVQFESINNQFATVSGDQVKGVSKGNVQIRAFLPGDINYDAAESFVTLEIYSTHKDIMHLFTPNSDGINDYWELPDLATWGKCDVRVFSRSGKLVYANANYNNLWDGTSNGSPLPEGAYYFIIKTENAGTVKGTVNIVR